MSKAKKNEAMEEDCGGLKPFNPIKAPTKKSAPTKKVTVKKAVTKKK